MKKADLYILLGILLLLVPLHGLYFWDRKLFVEGGPVETFQAGLLFCCGVTALWRARREDWKPYFSLYLLVGIAALFLWLEEINYGQRIFDFPVPAFFRRHNLQREISLHNFLYGLADRAIVGAVWVAAALMLLNRKLKIVSGRPRFLPHVSSGKLLILLLVSTYYYVSGFLIFACGRLYRGHLYYLELHEALQYFILLVFINIRPSRL